jgi:hypothetical protein
MKHHGKIIPTGLEKYTPEIHPKYDRISDRKCSKKYKLLTSNYEITMKIYGVRFGACIFWNIFGPISLLFQIL